MNGSIKNVEKNVKMTFNFISNQFLDIINSREKFENWIPFELILTVENERYEYLEDKGATLNLCEINDLIRTLDQIVNTKSNNKIIEKYHFSSLKGFFELIVDETYEKEMVYIEIWINIGTYSDGKTYGYDKGFRFVVSVPVFKNFCSELKAQLNSLIN